MLQGAQETGPASPGLSISGCCRQGFFGYNSGMQSTVTSCSKRQSGNIFLVGMMGSGKTTVGRMLAKQLGKTFIDCDEEIQKRTGVSVTHIFDVEGEAGFRRRETAVIHELVQLDNIVLATGGGAVLGAENRTDLASNGLVVYLKGSAHDLWHRIRHDRNRPLLQTADPKATIKELLATRETYYAQADMSVDTSNKPIGDIITAIKERIKHAYC